MPGLTLTRLKARSKVDLLGAALLLYAALHPAPAAAAEFSIYPISLQFVPGVRAAVVGINNSDKRPIRFQLTLVEWTQNAKGEDVYVPSEDLVFFPRQITVQAGQRAVARVGPKQGLPTTEKSYRLRVEELPEPLPESSEPTLNFTITFAVPVFLGTPEAAPKADIAPLQLQQGKLTATVHNSGNAHFRIESLEVLGSGGYTDKLAGWYLLPETSRDYVFAIPPDMCKTQKRLQLRVKVGEQFFDSALDIDPTQCGI